MSKKEILISKDIFEKNITQVIVDGVHAGNITEKDNLFFANIIGAPVPPDKYQTPPFITFAGAQEFIAREKKKTINQSNNQINMF
tara:strand:+ start:405 stop:659 length:255 start_codon:yes stop_codon:yes gene_type:complete